MSTFLWSILGFIVSIGILVTIHEFGHFIVARYFHVKVLRFSIGFGRVLYRFFDSTGCEYTICAIPLGGYVRMLDERESPVKKNELPFAFTRKSVPARLAIVLAGPFANFIFAIAAFFFMFYLGVIGVAPILGEVPAESYAEKAGLKSNDEIVMVNETPVTTWQEATSHIVNAFGDEAPLTLRVRSLDKQLLKTVSLHVDNWKDITANVDPLKALGLQMFMPSIPPLIQQVTEGEPAFIAGIQPHDKITALNGEKMDDWNVFVKKVRASIHIPLLVSVERAGHILQFTVVPRKKLDDTGNEIGYIGVGVENAALPAQLLRVEHYDALPAFKKACGLTYHYTALTLKVLGKMLQGEVSLRTLSGPISIAEGAGFAIQSGLDDFLNFLGIVSISLGVLNLLPIPVLDGGHALYCVWEAIFRKPVSLRAQVIGFKIGLVLLLILTSIAFFNDFSRL